jgi:hypothetical protein
MLAGSPAAADTIRCEVGADVRTVQVVYSDPGQPVPCEVIYGKHTAGTLETLWRADHEAGYCEAQARSFVSRLEGFGFRCTAATDEKALSPAEPR